MTGNTLSDAVKRLAQRHLPSASHLQALTIIWAKDAPTAPLGVLADRMAIPSAAALDVMNDLLESGLIEGGPETGFCPTADAKHAAEAALLMEANERFPVQLIRSIYEPPPSPAKLLADAFVLRKGDT